jgi:tellurite resistance protein TerC
VGTRCHPSVIPVVQVFGGAFFVSRNRRWFATPLFLALVMVEVTDVVLAIDSIPAIFSVTREPLIVYSSTMFAVLGLRSLYFLLAGITAKLRYLHTGLAAILIFVGAKMLVSYFAEIPTLLSLGVVSVILLVTVAGSLHAAKRDRGQVTQSPDHGHHPLRKDSPLSSQRCEFTTKLHIPE